MEALKISQKEAEKQVKELNLIWGIIAKVLDNEKDYISNAYFAINYKEEKEHASGKPSGVKNFLTVKEGAIYFCVKWIIDPLINGTRYTLKDFYKCRQSCLWGESLVLNLEKELKEALKGIDLKKVLSFDYCVLQNVE